MPDSLQPPLAPLVGEGRKTNLREGVMLRNRLFGAGLLAAALAFGLVYSLPGGEPAPPGKRAPIPDKAAQAKARKLIEEAYGEDYARARKEPAVLAGPA